MLQFLLDNLPTLLGATVVFGVFFLIIFKKLRDRKNHKGGCGGGCGHCPSAGICHPE